LVEIKECPVKKLLEHKPKKVLIVPDVHGFDFWKKNAYKQDYDEVVFLGDYVDEWHLTDEEIISNLTEIIEFKKQYPDKVTLLWGNHDVQYLYINRNIKCSGFRESYSAKLNEIFKRNNDLFKPIYRIDNVLFSHAGVSEAYARAVELYTGISDPVDSITEAWSIRSPICFVASHVVGGRDQLSGFLWARPGELTRPLPGYIQVVGHTEANVPEYLSDSRYYEYDENTSVMFVDNLPRRSLYMYI